LARHFLDILPLGMKAEFFDRWKTVNESCNEWMKKLEELSNMWSKQSGNLIFKHFNLKFDVTYLSVSFPNPNINVICRYAEQGDKHHGDRQWIW
jgi:hypothetical protein